MKRWIRFVAWFYPRAWREEFGDEFDAVLDDVRPGWRVFGNVLEGAVAMQISDGRSWLKVAGIMAAVGALVAFGLSFRVSPNYGSAGAVVFTPQADPIRPAAAEVLQERTARQINEMKKWILSRYELATMINDPSLNLYEADLKRKPLDDVVEQMRSDLRIDVTPSTKGGQGLVVNVSFFYPDQSKASAVVRALTDKFIEQNQKTTKFDADAYEGFWRDMSLSRHAPPAPPPPTGEVARALQLANLPAQPPNRGTLVLCGLLLGVFTAIAISWPRNTLRLAAFAIAGFVLAAAVSYLLPNRFTSTATMTVDPALLAENPLASPPPVRPAGEFLRQIEPEVLSSWRLALIIQNRRLNLYPEERRRKPMEEVVQNFRANLRITPLGSSPEAVSAFRISFTYPDRFLAQQTVEAVISATDLKYQDQQRAESSRMSSMAFAIWERHAGERLYVLDPPTLPTHPDEGPPRVLIALGGAVAGLLLGLVRPRRRRSDPPLPTAFQDAAAI